MLKVYGFNEENIKKILKFYGIDYDKLVIIIARGYESFCVPLFCINGKASILYTSGTKIPINDYENCKEGDIVGFYIKLVDEKDIFHELTHAKRILYGKALKNVIIEEIVVDIYSFFRMLQFELYSSINLKD